LAWEFDNGQPIYLQLVEKLRMKIASGAYAPGVRLPAVRALAADTGVNPNTLQRALLQLEAEGLILTQSTSGKYVTENAETIAALRLQLAEQRVTAFLGDMQALGLTVDDARSLILNYGKEDEQHDNT